MERGRCQPLHERWLSVVRMHADRMAVRLSACGTEFSFAELEQASREKIPSAGPGAGLLEMPASLRKAPGLTALPVRRNLGFILEVLRAWRENRVLQPVEPGGPDPLPPRPEWRTEICHVKTTSGSTGTPRRVLFEAGQLAADADQIVRTMGLRPEWPNIVCVSLAHSYGFSNLVLPLLLHGIPAVLPESPLPAALRQALESGPAFTLPAVPALWRAWLAAGVLDAARLPLAISAGAPLPLELEQTVFSRTGVKIHNFYGSSECGGIAYDRTETPRRDSRLAGTAMDGVTLSLDPASGCLRVHSASAGTGYEVPDVSLGAGFFLTTDHAILEENGGVLLEGRAGDAINIAGRKVSPSAIEEKLLALPGVRHCVVFGVPSADALRVEEIAAVLHLEPGIPLEEIRQASAVRLPAAEQPRHWRSEPELTPDARGKISRQAWKARWLAE